MNKQEIIELLDSFASNESFTIEQLVKIIRDNKGQKWEGVFEIQAQEDVESYLLKEGLIKECGMTKKYYKI